MSNFSSVSTTYEIRQNVQKTIENHLVSNNAENQMNDIVVEGLLKKQWAISRDYNATDFFLTLFSVMFSFIFICFSWLDYRWDGVLMAVGFVMLFVAVWMLIKHCHSIFYLAKTGANKQDLFAVIKILLNNSAADRMGIEDRRRYMKKFLNAMCEKSSYRRNRRIRILGSELSKELVKNYKGIKEREEHYEKENQVKNLLKQFQNLSEEEGVVKANLLYKSLKNMK